MDIDMRRLIKKPEKPVPKKTDAAPVIGEPIEPIVEPEIQLVQQSAIEVEPPQFIEVSQEDYIPQSLRPLRSVGNSGWQASDVWRELRVDNFCD